MGETKIERPGLPTPALRGCSDGDGPLLGRSAPRHPSEPLATENERLRRLFTPCSVDLTWDGRAEHLRMLAGCEPGSNCPYGPRELMVRTIRNVSPATELVTSKLKIVSETDHVANDQAHPLVGSKLCTRLWLVFGHCYVSQETVAQSGFCRLQQMSGFCRRLQQMPSVGDV
jgi:hypothetical protein